MQGAPAFMSKISSEATEKPGTGVLRMGAGELSKKNIRNEPDRSDLSFSFRLISCILIYNQNVISLRRKAKL